MALQKIFGHQMDIKAAGADLSASLWKAVSLNSSNALIYPAAAGNEIYGVVQDRGLSGASGTNVTVVLAGSGAITKIYAGGNVAIGAKVSANTSGLAITATTGHVSFGIARSGGASGDIIEVVLTGPETV